MSENPGISVQVVADEKQLEDWKKVIGRVAKPDEINAAMSRAINRALNHVRTATERATRKIYTASSRVVKDAQTVKKSSKFTLSGEVSYAGPNIPMDEFKHSPNAPISWKGVPNLLRTQQISLEIRKGVQREEKGLFLREKSGSDARIYKRKGKARFPLVRAEGPSVAGMVEGTGIAEEAQESANEMLAKRIDHEIMWMLGR